MGKSIDIQWIIDNWSNLKSLPEWENVIKPIIMSKDKSYYANNLVTSTPEKRLTDMINSYIIEDYIKKFLESCSYVVRYNDTERKTLYEGYNSHSGEADFTVYDIYDNGFLAEVKMCYAATGIMNYVLKGLENANNGDRCRINLHGAMRAYYFNIPEDALYYVEFCYYRNQLTLKTNEFNQPAISIVKTNCGLSNKLVDMYKLN